MENNDLNNYRTGLILSVIAGAILGLASAIKLCFF